MNNVNKEIVLEFEDGYLKYDRTTRHIIVKTKYEGKYVYTISDYKGLYTALREIACISAYEGITADVFSEIGPFFDSVEAELKKTFKKTSERGLKNDY